MSATRTFQSILVPVDGSPLAEAAVPYAVAIAERARSKVQFVFVYKDGFPLEPIELARQYLLQLTAQARERLGDSVSSVLLSGAVAPTLVKQARKIGADLVVITTHGRGGLERAWLGSVTDQLIRRIGIPLFVVRPVAGLPVPTFEPREILVPLDGSPLAEAALPPAAALAQLWDAELALVQIVHPLMAAADPAASAAQPYDKELTTIAYESATEYVKQAAEPLRNSGVKATGFALIATDLAAHQLRELASPERVSMVAMATHGRGGVRRLLLGSVTDKLVRTAQVPVLVVPPAPVVQPTRKAQPEKVSALGLSEAFASA